MNLILTCFITQNGKEIGASFIIGSGKGQFKKFKTCTPKDLVSWLQAPSNSNITLTNFEIKDGQFHTTNGANSSYAHFDYDTKVFKDGITPMVILAEDSEGRGYAVSNYDGSVIKNLSEKQVLAYAKQPNIGIANGKIVPKDGKEFISSIIGNYDSILLAPVENKAVKTATTTSVKKEVVNMQPELPKGMYTPQDLKNKYTMVISSNPPDYNTYDSYGHVIEDAEKYWTFYKMSNGYRVKLIDPYVSNVPTEIPVIHKGELVIDMSSCFEGFAGKSLPQVQSCNVKNFERYAYNSNIENIILPVLDSAETCESMYERCFYADETNFAGMHIKCANVSKMFKEADYLNISDIVFETDNADEVFANCFGGGKISNITFKPLNSEGTMSIKGAFANSIMKLDVDFTAPSNAIQDDIKKNAGALLGKKSVKKTTNKK